MKGASVVGAAVCCGRVCVCVFFFKRRRMETQGRKQDRLHPEGVCVRFSACIARSAVHD